MRTISDVLSSVLEFIGRKIVWVGIGIFFIFLILIVSKDWKINNLLLRALLVSFAVSMGVIGVIHVFLRRRKKQTYYHISYPKKDT